MTDDTPEPEPANEPPTSGPRRDEPPIGGSSTEEASGQGTEGGAVAAGDRAEPAEPVERPERSEPVPAIGAIPAGLTRADRVLRGLVGILRFRYVTALLVLLALAALYGVATLSRSPEPPRATVGAGTSAPVVAAAVACPAPAGGRLATLIPVTSRRDGQAIVTATGNAAPLARTGAPGTAWAQDIRPGAAAAGSYTIRAAGSYAAGLEAERTTHQPGGPDRGLAGVRCAESGTDQWFLGPGPAEAKDIDLYLTNIDAQPAAVDVTALSGEGPLDTTDGRGTPVAPYSTRVVRIGRSPEGLGQVAAGARVLGLRVHATTGRVAAAVRVRVDKKKGVDWVPSAPTPGTSLVVPGIPGGGGRRQLLVAVPGESDARVQIQAITPSGAFAPQGQGLLDAPAQTVSPLDLERALGGKPAAIRLVSDRPIAAGFTAEEGADVGYGTATGPLGAPGSARPLDPADPAGRAGPGGGPAAGTAGPADGPLGTAGPAGPAGAREGAVADNRFAATVLLSAPDGPATVRITGVAAQGAAGSPRDVTVAAGRTVEVRLAVPPGGEKGFGAFITPRPGSAAVYAARVMSSGRGGKLLFTVLPVVPARTAVPLPPVSDSLNSLIP